jgi:class I fructose-bisphosphate aldolase
VKPPTQALENLEAIKVYEKMKIPVSTMQQRIAHVMKTTFNNRRIVVFSGGNAKTDQELYAEIREIYKGGANGSIIGRNTFQRPREEALKMLENIIQIYQGKF